MTCSYFTVLDRKPIAMHLSNKIFMDMFTKKWSIFQITKKHIHIYSSLTVPVRYSSVKRNVRCRCRDPKPNCTVHGECQLIKQHIHSSKHTKAKAWCKTSTQNARRHVCEVVTMEPCVHMIASHFIAHHCGMVRV